MTLNLTALGADYIAQVSDRRLTYVNSSGAIKVDTDEANKAVVLSCADSLLAITFTGLGRLGRMHVDEWLLDVLQKDALCELKADIAVQRFSEIATNWFRAIRACWSGLHTFIIAGWQQTANPSHHRARLWFVTNSTSENYSSFAPISHDNRGMHVTGWLPSFTRTERRRVQAAGRKAKNIEQVEEAMVDCIRNAASRPDGTPIGKTCMSVILLPPRTAVTRFYPNGENPHTFAPHVVWNEGARNVAVRGMDYLPEGPYNLILGGGAGAITIRPGFGTGPLLSNEIRAKFGCRFSAAKYNTEPVRDISIIKVVDAW